MKHIFKYSLSLVAVMSLILTSCLKDKGFDNGTYGINGINSTILTMSAGKKALNSIAVDFVNTSQTVNMTGLVYESGSPTPSDINVTTDTLTSGANGLVTKWNADPANAANQLTPLPPGAFQIVNKVVKIASGEYVGTLQLRIPNATVLSTSTTYGVGVTMVSNDANLPFASNLKQALFAVSAKNKYDGNYSLRIKTVGWSAYGISDNLPETWPANADGTSIFMITGGANVVDFWDEWGFGTFIQVCFTAGNAGATGFGATSPRFTFDLATDQLISVVNTTPDDGRGRAFRLNPAVTDNRYDPSSKTIYAAYIMSQNGRPDQFIYDTLTYRSPRP